MRTNRSNTTWNQAIIMLLVALVFATAPAMLVAQPAQARIGGGTSEYYIPTNGDDVMQVLDIIEGTSVGSELTNVITISVVSDGTTVYYDHWENGYGTGTSGADETYVANRGDILTFFSDSIPYPRGTESMNDCTGSTFPAGGTGSDATHCYDGMDRLFVVGGAVSVSQAFWSTAHTTNMANAWEVYLLKPSLPST